MEGGRHSWKTARCRQSTLALPGDVLSSVSYYTGQIEGESGSITFRLIFSDKELRLKAH
jgi:hypothetical protein